MDYIFSEIQKRIGIYEAMKGHKRTMIDYYVTKTEYTCAFLLGYLWNQNIASLSEYERVNVFESIKRPPSLGTLVNVCQKLDQQKVFFGNKKSAKAYQALSKCIQLRNDHVGHGFTYKNTIDDVISQFTSASEDMLKGNHILSEEFDLVVVTDETEANYSGIRFTASGDGYYHWTCAKQVSSLQNGNVYAVRGVDNYLRLSPFIIIEPIQDIYIFNKLIEGLSGRVAYKKLLDEGIINQEWKELIGESNTGGRRMSRNGTTRNVYNNNYNKYINVSNIKNNIKKFLQNEYTVCATVWGHGGVGKTATIQSLCDDLSVSENRYFDYIVFASAKTRAFNHHKGGIYTIDNPIDSYYGLLNCVNVTLDMEGYGTKGIRDFEGRMLIVIDDYETFSSEDKEKIEEFILSLKVTHHKVIITTRANVTIGQAFQTDEFDIETTTTFLIEVMRSEYPEYSIRSVEIELNEEDTRQGVFNVTGGRPLFIFQLAHIVVQMGSVRKAIYKEGSDIKNKEDAVEFLYGKIYEYLTLEGRLLFQAIGGLLTEPDKLSNSITKLRYIVNMESEDGQFERGMKDLEKLRIVERFENDTYRVYSTEILKIMREAFQDADSRWRGNINIRSTQVTAGDSVEESMLVYSNRLRHHGSEQQVVRSYRQILNRDQSPRMIKIQAILNLTDYLFNQQNKKLEAIKEFKRYENIFQDNPSCIKMLSIYYWSVGESEKAVQTLRGLFTRIGYNWKSEDKDVEEPEKEFELLGFCLTYASISAANSQDELILRHRTGEIQDQEFRSAHSEIERKFRTVLREGRQLFQRVKRRMESEGLDKGSRQNIFNGLYNFSDIHMRCNQYKEARDICEFGSQDRFSHNYLESFKKRLDQLDELLLEKQQGRRRLDLSDLQEGQNIKGKVRKVVDFGAFIDLGGINGLLHKSDMTWNWERINHPSEVVKTGDELEVKILALDRTQNRISLGLKQLHKHPWEDIEKRYSRGQQLRGIVTTICDFGCFVEIEEGVTGLVYKSDMISGNSDVDPYDAVSLNAEVGVMLLNIDIERRRIKLSMAQYAPSPFDVLAKLGTRQGS